MFGKKQKPQGENAKSKAGSPYGPSHRASTDNGLPDNLIPKDLPKPDGLKKLPPSRMEPGGTNRSVMRPKKDKKKKGGCGCLIALTLLGLVPLGLVVVVALLSIRQFDAAGYVQQRSGMIRIVEPSEVKTLYIAGTITDEDHVTPAEVAYTAASVELSGIYEEDVYVRAISFHCTPGTVFEKNLEVFALSYHNEGTIIGELKGRIVRQKGLHPSSPE